MKIVFCGPPHSGKSVFIANLIDKLPTDAYTIIRACPDGEGTWSNNKKQNEIGIVRKKGKFTKSFIDDACKAIDNQTNKIVLVDVGGVMSKENEQVFQHCDSFIVLSSDEQKKNEWIKFGEKQGLECIGSIDSSLEGKEEIYKRTPFFKGKIVGLERGEILEKSSVISAIISDIIRKSKYADKDNTHHNEKSGIIIDDTELGFELGYGKEIETEDGIPIKKVKWNENALPNVYQAIDKKINSNKPVKINGIRANFVLCAICNALKGKKVSDISTYDIRTKSYIPIIDIPKKRGIKRTEGLEYNVIENKENVFMDIDITKEKYSLEEYKKCVLPKIKENKNLYISGRIPLWLLASISSSYNSNKIYTFQPGRGFTCISSIDEKDIGKIVDGVEGININKYFKDKKDKKILPVIKEKNSIVSKIKRLFNYNKENKKYIDDNIKSTIITSKDQSTDFKNIFKADIDIQHSMELPNQRKENQSATISKTDTQKSEIGGEK